MDTGLLWRSRLVAALHRNRSLPQARYVQLATVRPNGRPANRTVVFRGFAGDRGKTSETPWSADALTFVTDGRSGKLDDLQHCAWAEVCWYLPKTREQFRLAGPTSAIASHDADRDLRVNLWQSLSDGARLQFAWPPPGGDRAEPDRFSPQPPAPQCPPETFVVVLLEPEWVDWLTLRTKPHDRLQFDRQPKGTWQQRAVNP